MNRIRSQHGNVIAADFRPRVNLADLAVTLIRCTASMDGGPIATTHVLGDLATGNVTSL
ncbi:hypothetical protein J8F10_08950 [Gemmata sp. G18]|uniref:Uncharacterized protein n=1 Tax=Gemmata palustris TaxID=2822762 RepID=A0ABS5BPN3_9BACT|nr:hypothetical protein [Gemmata palustris]MBP3955407.1 hypothetical protein [Gemmata palustris]